MRVSKYGLWEELTDGNALLDVICVPCYPPRTTNQCQFGKEEKVKSHTFVLSESLVLVDYRCIFSFGGHPARSTFTLWMRVVKIMAPNWHQFGPISEFLTVARRKHCSPTQATWRTHPIPVVFSNAVILQLVATLNIK